MSSNGKANGKIPARSNGKHPGGRPPLYASPPQLQRRIDQYFKRNKTKPTISGLALFCGFYDRQHFETYADKPEFLPVVKSGISRIAAVHEARMFGGHAAGSIFWLKNFGWSDRTELSGPNGEPFKLIIEAPSVSAANRMSVDA